MTYPWKTPLAMIEEAREYGTYPLPEKPPEGADTGEDYEPWDPSPKRQTETTADGRVTNIVTDTRPPRRNRHSLSDKG